MNERRQREIKELFKKIEALNAQKEKISTGFSDNQNKVRQKTKLLPEDYDVLIDLALATNDEEWFKELFAKKQSVTKKA